MTAMVESGCDIIEVGVAYSDPGMDGPTIAAATEVALARRCAGAGRTGRGRGDQQGGRPRRRHDLLESGAAVGSRRVRARPRVGGRSRPDHPGPDPRRGRRVDSACPTNTVSTGSSSSRRRRRTSGWPPPSQASRGFVYAASTMGVTGARDAVSDAAPELVRRVSEVSDIPVGVGLGVRSREQAARDRCLRRRRDRRFGVGDGAERGIPAVRALTEELADGRATEDFSVTTTVLAFIPSPSQGVWHLRRRCRFGRMRCASSPASSRHWSSAIAAGWPAVASAASSTTSRCGRCRSA